MDRRRVSMEFQLLNAEKERKKNSNQRKTSLLTEVYSWFKRTSEILCRQMDNFIFKVYI